MRSLQFRAINNSITPIATTLESLAVLGDTTKTNGRYRYNCRTADDNINKVIHSSFNTTNNPITEEEEKNVSNYQTLFVEAT